MKKIILKITTIFLFITIICLLGLKKYAANNDLVFSGETNIKPGTTNTVDVEVNSSNSIVTISGIIECTSDIKDISIKEKNGWTLTYNSDTGNFQIFKASGASKESIMTITYTLANNTNQTQKITLKDLSITTTAYNTTNPSDLIHEIKISNGSEQENTTKENTTNENTTKQNITNENTAKQNTSGKSTNSSSSKVKKLPYTGRSALGVLAVIAIIALIAVYYRYTKYYKDI